METIKKEAFLLLPRIKRISFQFCFSCYLKRIAKIPKPHKNLKNKHQVSSLRVHKYFIIQELGKYQHFFIILQFFLGYSWTEFANEFKTLSTLRLRSYFGRSVLIYYGFLSKKLMIILVVCDKTFTYYKMQSLLNEYELPFISTVVSTRCKKWFKTPVGPTRTNDKKYIFFSFLYRKKVASIL